MEHAEPPEFSITRASLDGSLIIGVVGELDLATAPQLDHALEYCNEGAHVVVDLTALSFIDSTGLHVLLKKRPNGKPAAVVVAPDSHVAHVFDIVAASKIVFLCNDVQTAIQNSGQTNATATSAQLVR